MKENTEGIKTEVIKCYGKRKAIRIIQIPVKPEIRNK